jgi:glutamate/aspartate transport system substrate-binding protein
MIRIVHVLPCLKAGIRSECGANLFRKQGLGRRAAMRGPPDEVSGMGVLAGRVAALMLCCATQLAAAQELTGALKKIRVSGAISVGYRESSVPFSYYDGKQQVVGYAMDLCRKIVEGVQRELKLSKLDVKLIPVTPANRIALIANGAIDLECGSTTNNPERQKQVAFTITHFVAANRFVSKPHHNLSSIDDLAGKAVVSTAGTTSIKQLSDINAKKGLGITIIPASDHAEAFLMVETDRAVAFVMDDIILYSLVASSRSPNDYAISADALSVEPYGIMLPKDDPAFKKVADSAMISLYRNGEINALYEKWFLKPIPPAGINLKAPMGDALRRAIASPTDSGDPAVY